jgi:hypothetical protein
VGVPGLEARCALPLQRVRDGDLGLRPDDLDLGFGMWSRDLSTTIGPVDDGDVESGMCTIGGGKENSIDDGVTGDVDGSDDIVEAGVRVKDNDNECPLVWDGAVGGSLTDGVGGRDEKENKRALRLLLMISLRVSFALSCGVSEIMENEPKPEAEDIVTVGEEQEMVRGRIGGGS